MASNILERLEWRYACKKFDTSQKLPKDKLDILKEAFNLTATSYGLQPLKLLIIGSDSIKEQLVSLSMDQLQVKEASHVLVICRETKIDSTYINSYFDRVEATRKTSREVLQPFEKYLVTSFSEKQQEEIEQWTVKQAYIALGNLITVCAVEGIDACPMEGFEADKYDRFLQLKEKGLQSVLVLPVGYRADDDMFSSMAKVRKGVGEVVIEM